MVDQINPERLFQIPSSSALVDVPHPCPHFVGVVSNKRVTRMMVAETEEILAYVINVTTTYIGALIIVGKSASSRLRVRDSNEYRPRACSRINV